MRTWEDWKRLLADVPLPAAVLDLDALDHNLGVLTGALGDGLTLRVASKSIRVPAVLRYLLDAEPRRLRGLMTFSAHETAWLAEQGFDDLLLAYPIARADEAAALARAATRAQVWAAVDDVAQARLLSAAAQGAGVTIGLCLDIDASWRPLPGVHLGVRRSPLRSAADAVAVAQACRALPGVEVNAVLAYEAQVAGLPDVAGPGLAGRATGMVKQLVKRRSIPLVARRRQQVVAALRSEGFHVGLVNGGGSGSVASTSRDPSVTEVTAGSGFVASHLFDGYRGLPWQPALVFALAVVRQSDADHVTCAGGGYIASGSAGPDRMPQVLSPGHLVPVDLEGWGEVQTPFRVGDGPVPALGDPVICRHAKAGELAERFASYLLVRGDRIVEQVPTARGLGRCFF
ncbi:MAG: alanine racemase [Alphaproteobacteria bacterium]|nr:alanine racemase [Alphaproteobacteria bacterium]